MASRAFRSHVFASACLRSNIFYGTAGVVAPPVVVTVVPSGAWFRGPLFRPVSIEAEIRFRPPVLVEAAIGSETGMTALLGQELYSDFQIALGRMRGINPELTLAQKSVGPGAEIRIDRQLNLEFDPDPGFGMSSRLRTINLEREKKIISHLLGEPDEFDPAAVLEEIDQ